MRLQAVLDHFGYDCAFFSTWNTSTWFDQEEFNSWFALLRKNRRIKEIMPLYEISSSDSDDDHDVPRSDSGKKLAIKGVGKSSGATSGSKDASTSKDDDKKEGSDGKGGNGKKSILPGSLQPSSSELQVNKFNPLILKENVSASDFEEVGMLNPFLEDINSIIAISERGVYSQDDQDKIDCAIAKTDDFELPSIQKRVITGCLVHFKFASHPGGIAKQAKRGFMAAKPIAIDHTGWRPRRGTNPRARAHKLMLKTKMQCLTRPHFPERPFAHVALARRAARLTQKYLAASKANN